MYVIETRYFKDEHVNTILVILPDRVIIQKSDSDDDAVLEEWSVPFLKHGKGFETTFKISQKYFETIKKDCYINVFENFFETPRVRVNFKQEEYLTWDTFTGDPSCFMVLPEFPELEGDDILLEVRDDTGEFTVTDDNFTYVFKNIKTFQKGSVRLVPCFFENVLKTYRGKVCKLSVKEENPLCVEFDDGHRIFIAPVV